MENFIPIAILLFIVVSIWAFRTWRALEKANKLKQCVCWSVCDSDSVRYNIPLWAHFKNAQIDSHIRDEYLVSGEEEWTQVKEIIEKFRKDLTQSYFIGQLSILKSSSKYAVRDYDYFIYMLYVYLCNHEAHGNNVVFYKMQYVTYLYCKQSLVLQNNVPAWNEERLARILDSILTQQRAGIRQGPTEANILDNPSLKINWRN